MDDFWPEPEPDDAAPEDVALDDAPSDDLAPEDDVESEEEDEESLVAPPDGTLALDPERLSVR